MTPQPIDKTTNQAESESTLSRRTIISTAAAAGVGGASLFVFGSGSASAEASVSDFNAEDTETVTDNDGDVEEVYIEPDIELGWEDFGNGIDAIDVVVEADVDDTNEAVFDITLENSSDTPAGVEEIGDGDMDDDFGSTDGQLEVNFEEHAITEDTSIDSDDFSRDDLGEGESAETNVELTLEAMFNANEGEDANPSVEDDFYVEVENPDGDGDVGGDANTSAE